MKKLLITMVVMILAMADAYAQPPCFSELGCTGLPIVLAPEGFAPSIQYTTFPCSSGTKLQLDFIYGGGLLDIPGAIQRMLKHFIETKNPQTPYTLTIYVRSCWSLSFQPLMWQPCASVPCCTNTVVLGRDYSGNIVITSNTLSSSEMISCPPGCTKVCSGLSVPPDDPLQGGGPCFEDCYWTLNGNGNVGPDDFMGSTNPADVIFKSNNYERMRIRGGAQNEEGTQINIGQGRPVDNDNDDYMLSVAGKLVAQELVVTPSTWDTYWDWPDYVFEKDYKLKPLEQVEAFISSNKRLEEMPSASEVQKKGINIAELNRVLLKKVEELTLYLINMSKDISEDKHRLQKEIDELKKKLEGK